jgi:hypothetical protein
MSIENIEIETNFIPLILAYDDFPEGVKLIRQPFMERRDLGYDSIAKGILTFSSGIAISVIASWIYEKIKRVKGNKKFFLKINEKTVLKITKEGITEAIEREIKITKKNKT